ncbi:O-antigen ligase family protein [Bythopirellula polymerisocia]|uniref:O-antigen ligase-related domain-containing protein n=1 Tax=Bythopirellula polymerisocia TaxID=2528003 RepID=A0A5C6CT22_9BACT|nr:O-antigen ligase family protein [Bythopirellula polymerisocia]TWU28093.1 hypothetical protein Pla144_13800 [Bythopirellula polymerisocia]
MSNAQVMYPTSMPTWRNPLAATIAMPSVSIISPVGIIMLLLGASLAFPVHIAGRAYLGEFFLAILATYGLLQLLSGSKGLAKSFLVILVAMLLSLLGYVLSDLHQQTPPSDYLRGWARWAFMITNFIGLTWIVSRNPTYLYILLVGWAVASPMAGWHLGLHAPMSLWKFFGASQLPFVVLFFVRYRSPKFITVACLGLAALNAALDTRSNALICAVVAGVVFLAGRQSSPYLNKVSLSRFIKFIIILGLCFGVAVFSVKWYSDQYGYERRQSGSDTKRSVSAQVCFQAIMDSPIIGYGSWAKSPELAKLRDRLIEKQINSHVFRADAQEDRIVAHSQLLQGWLEGGLLGLFFFAFLGVQMAIKGTFLTIERGFDSMTPLFATSLLLSGWHLIFSPFNGDQRMLIAAACAVLCYLANEKYVLRNNRNYYVMASSQRPMVVQ